jgi:hypothetical protein
LRYAARVEVDAYFTVGKPLKGKEEFEHKCQGPLWRFVSVQNRDLFAAEPESYAPRYGSYCAGGMALGRKTRIDPEAFAIVDGQLYLNYSKRDRDEFAEDSEAKIAEADRNWAKLESR